MELYQKSVIFTGSGNLARYGNLDKKLEICTGNESRLKTDFYLDSVFYPGPKIKPGTDI